MYNSACTVSVYETLLCNMHHILEVQHVKECSIVQ